MTAATLVLELDGVACTFTSRDDPSQRYTAVRDVSLTVGDGEFVSVVGPTGCGKSTLLNVAAGLLAPSSGQVTVFGAPLVGINRRAGYMFQTESLMPWRTALANVMAGLQFRGVTPREAREQAEAWLQRVGLGGFGDRYPHQLSGGMRKRVGLAQTLVLDPDIILMDEPFSALDPNTRARLRHQLVELWQETAKTILFVTHDVEEALFLADRIIVLSPKPARVIEVMTVKEPRPRYVESAPSLREARRALTA
ncbi:MAG TPA: ABC transporter ATP-binding protein, partial [Burkholderiaceae bacterium]